MFTKSEVLDTWSRYVIAPMEAFHTKTGPAETPIAMFGGESNIGAAGAGPATVVKFQTVEYALVPAAFVAFTRQ